jgi:hypothetical protein
MADQGALVNPQSNNLPKQVSLFTRNEKNYHVQGFQYFSILPVLHYLQAVLFISRVSAQYLKNEMSDLNETWYTHAWW